MRDRRHDDLDLGHVLVRRAAGGINTKSDQPTENDVSRGHALEIGRDYARAVLVTFFGAIDSDIIRAFFKVRRPGVTAICDPMVDEVRLQVAPCTPGVVIATV